jgi:glycosidase
MRDERRGAGPTMTRAPVVLPRLHNDIMRDTPLTNPAPGRTDVSMHVRRLATLTLLASLAACGGGNSGLPPPPPPPPPPTVDVSHVDAVDPGTTLPDGWQHGAFMEIFVRSYQDSDGDGIGDLKGLTSRLDYLQDLGIKGIWLMPVTASEDHDHGYAVENYRDIEHDYGTLADLDEFIAQAHARGIGVVLDYVMNHSAATNPIFVNSEYSTTNAYRDWYLWLAQDPGTWSIYGMDPWRSAATGYYFGAFSTSMPDWNLTNDAVVEYHHDNQRFWLNRGVDGFRFDAVGNFVENGPSDWSVQPQDDVIIANVHSVVTGYANRWMVCEVPDAPQRFGAANVCGSAFAFDLNYNDQIGRAAQGDTAAIAAVAQYFVTAPAGMSTMASNHDSFDGPRLWDQVHGNQAEYRLAAATYLLLPGTPFVYYGEEVGLAGSTTLQGDAALRTPMSWTNDTSNAGFTTGVPYRGLSGNVATNNVAAQLSDPNSLHAFYKAIIGLRNSRPSIAQGAYVAPFSNGSVMGFQRTSGNERTLVVYNYGLAATVATPGSLPANGTLTMLYPTAGGTTAIDGTGQASVTLGAQSFAVYSVAP